MEKRLLLAMSLSLLVLLVFSSMTQKSTKSKPVEVRSSAAGQSQVGQTAAPVVEPVPEPQPQTLPPTQEADIINRISMDDKELKKIETSSLVLKFSSVGGYLVKGFDKTHNVDLPFVNIGLVEPWANYPFEATVSDRAISFVYSAQDGARINKVFSVRGENEVDLDITLSATNIYVGSTTNVQLGMIDVKKEKDQVNQRYFEYAASVGGVIDRKPPQSIKQSSALEGKIEWFGLRDRYFCAVFSSQPIMNEIDMKNMSGRYVFRTPLLNSGPGATSGNTSLRFYLGLQDTSKIKKFKEGSERVVNYGKFDPIAMVLLALLNFFQRVTHSWGVAIILMTIAIYIVLFPLSWKSMLSMKKMQLLQPKIEEIRTKYKDNPQKMNTETMELYKREKVNPFGGCLPMLLQIPVFFALYQLLMRYITLKGTPFLWIKDLSEPDRLIIFSREGGGFIKELNILPLLMAGIMFFQQRLTSPPMGASSQAAEQQKIMAIMMPIMFGFLFYNMPSGLVIYWLVNSLLMFAFQWKISAKTKVA